eukprot:scaffold43727_cov35-Phaeocystis_antarctica.AAC.2
MPGTHFRHAHPCAVGSNRPSQPARRLSLQCAGHCKRPGRGLGRCADGHRGTDRLQYGAASAQGVRCDAAATAAALASVQQWTPSEN